MRFLFLLLLPIWCFASFTFVKWFIEFCADNMHRWWGGLPLWMTGVLTVFLPLFFGGGAAIFYLVFH